MTKASMALTELAEKGPDLDMLREMLEFATQRLMEFDVENRCRAPYGERGVPRANSRNGYRSELGTVTDNDIVLVLHVFVMVLGYSGKMFAAFATSMDELVLQRMHVAAFRFFGGVPLHVLYGNMRTVTIGRGEHFKPVLQRDFVDFSALYGFDVKCARPYSPRTKGKVERAIGFIQTSFLQGRDFSNGLMAAQRQLDEWVVEANARLHRAHGEIVGERFAREAPLLTPLRSGLTRWTMPYLDTCHRWAGNTST